MRLRRVATGTFEIKDRNNGQRHEHAFVKNIRRNGLLHEADLLPDSYGGKFHPRAVPELVRSLPAILRALQRRKVTPGKALLHPHKADAAVRRIFDHVEGKRPQERYELNLYVTGTEDEPDPAPGEAVGPEGTAVQASAGGSMPEERSPNR
jgi:succinate dehydrogenase / fumarate reductase, iron-sulfur subunit